MDRAVVYRRVLDRALLYNIYWIESYRAEGYLTEQDKTEQY